jgi:hypothetical protein
MRGKTKQKAKMVAKVAPAKPAKVATTLTNKGKAPPPKGSVVDVTMSCIRLCERKEGATRAELESLRHGGNEYWHKALANACKGLNLKFREGSQDGRSCFFVSK